jgi:hypothetical protein
MSLTHMGSVTVTAARTSHWCGWCPTLIDVGDSCEMWTYIDDGRWVHMRMHRDCLAAMERAQEGALHDEPYCGDNHERGAECEHG